MPFDEALFWVGITVFGTGLYFVIERASQGVRWLAGLTTVVGLVATGYSIYAKTHPNLPMPSLWIYLLVLTWILVGADIYSRQHKTPTFHEKPQVLQERPKGTATAVVTQEKQTCAISAEQLIALFKRGETTADGERLVEPYIDMWLSFSGEIEDVRTSSITFKGHSFFAQNGLNTSFSEKHRERLLTLRPGNVVTVLGQVRNISAFEVALYECEIVS
jgi:hypothetical protein